MENREEIWQVDVNGQIFESSLAELGEWINDGALLRHDKVRRGNLRWLDAGKVPLLHGFFNAKELGQPMPILKTTGEFSQAAEELFVETQNFVPSQNVIQNTFGVEFNENEIKNPSQGFKDETKTFAASPQTINEGQRICAVHADAEPKFVCETCAGAFCAQCPKSYGGNVKICPLCGALCKPIDELKAVKEKVGKHHYSVNEGFGFSDFAKALAYPFKFKISLIFGAVMFMFFSLGQSASALGGMFMFAAACFCAMMANALSFGVLANTVENFSQGKLETNFMPDFDDFSLWDEVVHPFFLSIGVYLISFGLFIIIGLGAMWYAWSSISGSNDLMPQKSVSAVMPEVQGDLSSAKQIPQIDEIRKQLNANNQWKNGQMPDANQIEQTQNKPLNNEEAEFQRLEEMIRQNRKAQVESVIGKTPEEERAAFGQMAVTFLQTAKIFLIPLFLALLWALFYFPAACAVAGYTRSFTATLNPSVGLDTIKNLGFDYAKILMMCLVLIVFSGIAGMILSSIFAPFDLPKMGNLPAKAAGSLFSFYLSIVFSVILGYALYKNSEKLNLYRV